MAGFSLEEAIIWLEICQISHILFYKTPLEPNVCQITVILFWDETDITNVIIKWFSTSLNINPLDHQLSSIYKIEIFFLFIKPLNQLHSVK